MSNVTLLNMDCMEYMATLPDNAFELAIVDPPYGINIAEWDKSIPDEKYFQELFRVSNHQIIWGANYFNLPHTESWLCWDKTYKFNRNIEMAEFELAWMSYDKKAKFIRYTYCGNFYGWEHPKADYKKPINIHPTQKPVALYQWLLKNYAKQGDRILDTHLGSGSSAIAADIMGFDFVGIEIDESYFLAAKERFEKHKAQTTLFDGDIYLLNHGQPQCGRDDKDIEDYQNDLQF